MTIFTAKTFEIPALTGISRTNIDEHLKLYAGYVKHANLIQEHIAEFKKDSEKYAYEFGELSRRFSFEYNGMRNHEYYFEQLEGGTNPLSNESTLYSQISSQWGSVDAWLAEFKMIAKTRGVGWAILYHDTERGVLMNNWVDEQHLGHLNSCQFIFGIDMWEHAFVADYQPSGKGKYIDDYIANVNWEIVTKRFRE